MSNREILFRGMRVDGSNNWVYGSLIKSDKECFIISPKNLKIGYNKTLSNTSVQPVIPETVGQYTGLMDKNEIDKLFEGDIIDEYGLKIGNIHEIHARKTDYIIPRIGGKDWEATHEERLDRGLKYT